MEGKCCPDVAKAEYETGPNGRVIEKGKFNFRALDKQEGGTHYKNFAIQPVEFITKNNLPFIVGNVIKYVVRARSKNGIEDLRKAKHYLELEAELVYGEKL